MFRLNKKSYLLSIGFLSFVCTLGHAEPMTKHIVVAPQCLIQQLKIVPTSLATHDSLSLIEVDDAGINQLIDVKTHQKILCGGFMDVTHAWHTYRPKQLFGAQKANAFLSNYAIKPDTATAKSSAYQIKHPLVVNEFIKFLNPQEMWDDLSSLVQFKDRHANSDSGVKAAEWFKQQMETLAKDYHREDVNISLIATGARYKQPSVIAKVGDSTEPGIVVGAHMDTLSSTFSRKPGADDDGTGSVTVLQTAKALFRSGIQFKKPIYFIWYAAEEEGMVGSGYVVEEFKRKNIPVDGVLHFDLTGFAYHNENTLWLINDYVNRDLTSFLEKLINTYVKQPVQYTRCGYACSDHATWTAHGYKAAIPAEAAFENTNPSIHSAQDTMEKLSLAHMTDYAKLAAAFVTEMANPA